ncbi:hypothetical protein [Streptomyces gilvus]|uniref:hypothetical protein n=1 Tax=Streptomyces gilvus TaxID=2920937 RepID=UPI001F1108B2|nr:hypothetical protein [Streptomyces sp. CME 23]MCH5677859.1 hypothetical protein [Streptomyces sp. CME 23]
MSAEAWLIILAVAALALFVVAGVIDELANRQPPSPIGQPVRHTLPPLPRPTRLHINLDRVRAARPAVGDAAGSGRHRSHPGEPT